MYHNIILHLETRLPMLSEEKTSVEIIITFRALQQNGMLFLMTADNESNALFTAGMYNGQVRID